MIIQQYTITDKKALLTAYLHDTDEIRPAIIVCPGGAYMLIGNQEGEPVAEKFYEYGFQAFVLTYSTISSDLHREHPEWTYEQTIQEGENIVFECETLSSNYPNPLIELTLAMKFIKDNCTEFHIDNSKIGVIGFSAGGHLTALYGNKWHEEWLLNETGLTKGIKPWFQGVCYGVTHMDENYLFWLKENQPGLIKMYKAFFNTVDPKTETMIELSPAYTVNKHTPPTFIWHTTQDELVPVIQSLSFANALEKNHIPWEAHFYEQGGHGLSTADQNIHVQTWFNLLIDWLRQYR